MTDTQTLRSLAEQAKELNRANSGMGRHVAVSPDRILSLLDRVEELEGALRENEKLRDSIERCPLTHSYLLPNGKHLTYDLGAALEKGNRMNGRTEEGHEIELSWERREKHIKVLRANGFDGAADYIEALDDCRVQLETTLDPEREDNTIMGAR